MKTSFIILIIFFSSLSISEIQSFADESVRRTDEEVVAMYEEWMMEYKKSYSALEEEKLKRFEIFKDNLKYIDKHNSLPNQTYKLGLNQFSDLTFDEFESMYLNSNPIDTSLDESEVDFSYLPEINYSISIPDSIDWRKRGAVVPIKNQNPCGSCWAFSAVASVEALNKIKGGSLISLSEQMLVDCVTSSYGCKGGRTRDGFNFMTRRGIATSKDYPYEAKKKTCRNKKIVVRISGYKNIASKNEKALQAAVASQVVSSSIKSSKDVQHYRSGIFSGKCGDKLNHAVNIVGYGSEKGKAYWIIRNSWGQRWGEKGYMRMARNIGSREGCCGIALSPVVPFMRLSTKEGNISSL